MKSKTSVQTSGAANAHTLLASMTRDQLRAVASKINVPRGKSTKDTIANLEKAIAAGNLHFKATCTLSFKPADGTAPRETYFGKTLRTYVSGPGKGDEVWLTPDMAVTGSPMDPSEPS